MSEEKHPLKPYQRFQKASRDMIATTIQAYEGYVDSQLFLYEIAARTRLCQRTNQSPYFYLDSFINNKMINKSVPVDMHEIARRARNNLEKEGFKLNLNYPRTIIWIDNDEKEIEGILEKYKAIEDSDRTSKMENVYRLLTSEKVLSYIHLEFTIHKEMERKETPFRLPWLTQLLNIFDKDNDYVLYLDEIRPLLVDILEKEGYVVKVDDNSRIYIS